MKEATLPRQHHFPTVPSALALALAHTFAIKAGEQQVRDGSVEEAIQSFKRAVELSSGKSAKAHSLLAKLLQKGAICNWSSKRCQHNYLFNNRETT